MLKDKSMTKIELKDKEDVSTNIVATMGKGEPVSMESLAKITTALRCGIDNIVEITSEKKRGV